MVGHVQSVLSIFWRQARRPLDSARERPVRRREWGLPHLGEFIHQPRRLGLVGLVVHKGDDPLAGQDHARQSWPVLQGHGNFRGCVDHILQAGTFNNLGKVARCNVVRISHEDGDHIVRMLPDPLRHGSQIRLESSHVEQITVAVA